MQYDSHNVPRIRFWQATAFILRIQLSGHSRVPMISALWYVSVQQRAGTMIHAPILSGCRRCTIRVWNKIQELLQCTFLNLLVPCHLLPATTVAGMALSKVRLSTATSPRK